VDLIRDLEAGGSVVTLDVAAGTTIVEPLSVSVIEVLRERYRREAGGAAPTRG
jgi:hypothetical protein